uniref:vomeronasal type-1 receptor 4-like n=1 Tax=Jaculus jaculus TaxID=51337 RepID=UPI001E1B5EDC|nr:vomeronasal type-1 receptor 4-like [Jaculus jaculus]
MDSRDMTVGVIFLFQTALGILGNSACLSLFFLADFTRSKVKPTDLIVKHLNWANLMVLLLKGVPQTMAAFGMSYFLDDILCKLIFYFHRVARGVSLGSTSLLSVFQVITISPSNSMWVQLKVRANTTFIWSGLGLWWALQLLANIAIPMRVTDLLSARNLTGSRDYVYCATVDPGTKINMYVVLLASTDAMCLGLMALSSGSMVLILTKHRQRVQHIHSSQIPRSSPEARATHSILTIVSSFVLFYTISLILTMYLTYYDGRNRWLVNANVAMSACFPALCPFLLISQYTAISNLCCVESYKKTVCPCVVIEL